MLQARQHPNFPDEPQFARLGARIRVQNLDRELALVPRIFCEIDGSECSLPYLTLNFIPSGERNA